MKLAPIFNHHTVLQANRPIRIYGIGRGSATIRLNGEEKSIRSEGGFWCVTFSPRSYGGPYELSVTLNGETSVYTDIYVGEVLLLAGQSNMGFKLHKTSFPTDRYEDEPMVRYFASERFGTEDAFAPKDGWTPCTKETAPYFS